MITHSENADILVHEAYSKDWMEEGIKRVPHMEKIIKGVMNIHTSTAEAAEIAEKAKVKHLVFTHLSLGDFEKDKNSSPPKTHQTSPNQRVLLYFL